VRPCTSDPCLDVVRVRWIGIGLLGFVRCAGRPCPISWSNVFTLVFCRFGQRRQVLRDLGERTGNCNSNRGGNCNLIR
jgi:hypothetical protein